MMSMLLKGSSSRSGWGRGAGGGGGTGQGCCGTVGMVVQEWLLGVGSSEPGYCSAGVSQGT